jgi:hypothetical protein
MTPEVEEEYGEVSSRMWGVNAPSQSSKHGLTSRTKVAALEMNDWRAIQLRSRASASTSTTSQSEAVSPVLSWLFSPFFNHQSLYISRYVRKVSGH